MTLGTHLRGIRVVPTMLACAGLALSPFAATAAAKSKKPTASTREAGNTKPKTVAKRQTPPATTGLGNSLELSAGTQLAAMNTALKAAPAFYAGRTTECTAVVPLLASLTAPVIGGNFRDSAGACYVWLNLKQSSMLTGSEICKVALHEYGHLAGLGHSPDENDVMYAPFHADPIPAPCQAHPSGSSAKARNR